MPECESLVLAALSVANDMNATEENEDARKVPGFWTLRVASGRWSVAQYEAVRNCVEIQITGMYARKDLTAMKDKIQREEELIRQEGPGKGLDILNWVGKCEQ